MAGDRQQLVQHPPLGRTAWFDEAAVTTSAVPVATTLSAAV
jgi:hypothetical protein